MKLTESMIRDMVKTELSAEQIGDLLTMTGFEIESIEFVDGEPVLDINIMANRGDGASTLGIAREILAKSPESRPTDLYERLVSGYQLGDEKTPLAEVVVESGSPDCTRFSARRFKGIVNGDSPDWIQDRLRKVGQRPISLLVDLTNYVMLETGQPMHAYDIAKLGQPKLIARQARPGETVRTLNGQDHKLGEGHLMICDGKRPVGVAGVMGGESTEVDAATTDCLLESAHFDHMAVRKTRKQLGLQTDASYRFERFVDPEGTVRSMNRFADLLHQATGVDPVAGIADDYPTPPKRPTVKVRPSRCSRLLGMDVSSSEVETYLTRLGVSLDPVGDGFQATPPTWRIDLVREDDFVEEVGRIHGYDKIPEALPIGSTPVGGSHGANLAQEIVLKTALACGFDQAINHTMRDLHPLDGGSLRVKVLQPHSPELAHLRGSLLPGLADTALKNGGESVHFFEIGRVFSNGSEWTQLGMLSQGQFDPPSWNRSEDVADFYTLKGAVESVLKALAISVEFSVSKDPRLHPTRQAHVGKFGVMGQIHPAAAEEAGLAPDTFLAEIDLTALVSETSTERHYRQVYRHPAARRDIAVVVPKSVRYADIESTIAKACGELLEKHWLFDIYDGPGIDPGSQSLAIALQFRKPSNFTDDEANQVRDLAVRALEALGAKLR